MYKPGLLTTMNIVSSALYRHIVVGSDIYLIPSGRARVAGYAYFRLPASLFTISCRIFQISSGLSSTLFVTQWVNDPTIVDVIYLGDSPNKRHNQQKSFLSDFAHVPMMVREFL